MKGEKKAPKPTKNSCSVFLWWHAYERFSSYSVTATEKHTKRDRARERERVVKQLIRISRAFLLSSSNKAVGVYIYVCFSIDSHLAIAKCFGTNFQIEIHDLSNCIKGIA